MKLLSIMIVMLLITSVSTVLTNDFEDESIIVYNDGTVLDSYYEFDALLPRGVVHEKIDDKHYLFAKMFYPESFKIKCKEMEEKAKKNNRKLIIKASKYSEVQTLNLLLVFSSDFTYFDIYYYKKAKNWFSKDYKKYRYRCYYKTGRIRRPIENVFIKHVIEGGTVLVSSDNLQSEFNFFIGQINIGYLD